VRYWALNLFCMVSNLFVIKQKYYITSFEDLHSETLAVLNSFYLTSLLDILNCQFPNILVFPTSPPNQAWPSIQGRLVAKVRSISRDRFLCRSMMTHTLTEKGHILQLFVFLTNLHKVLTRYSWSINFEMWNVLSRQLFSFSQAHRRLVQSTANRKVINFVNRQRCRVVYLWYWLCNWRKHELSFTLRAGKHQIERCFE